jgi:dihydrodipicolinate synthase/N-acetylneuraminate lyase
MATPSFPPSPIDGPPRYPRVIMGTCVVPWRADGALDEPLFRRTVRHSVATLTRHLYVFGTAGEGDGVTDRQFEAVVRAFVAEMNAAGGIPMVGVISLSLGTVIERIEFARSLGVSEFQLSLPAWGTLNDVELDRFFAETCGRFPDARFLHYNLARARRVLTGTDYARLAARHANLVAIKMGGEVTALREVAMATPVLRCFFTEFGYGALRDETGCGLLCSIGVSHPPLAQRWYAASAAERARLEPTLRAIHAALKAAVGTSAHMDGAYDKQFVKLHFPEFPLRLLPPYSAASDAEFEQFRAACHAAIAALPTPQRSVS